MAEKFGARLEALGATVERSEETHHPHDAGAYRRSRQTAVKLLKGQPSAIFDLHRDGIPDPEEYAVTIGGEKMSKVRLLVGKSNQNREANLSFAKQIKAVGDKLYPKLIKDIYMGKGTYNQDLAPRSVLLEFGTHTLSKERVLRSTGPMAEVCYKALFGGVTRLGRAPATSAAAKRRKRSGRSVQQGLRRGGMDHSGAAAGRGPVRVPFHRRQGRSGQMEGLTERNDGRVFRGKTQRPVKGRETETQGLKKKALCFPISFISFRSVRPGRGLPAIHAGKEGTEAFFTLSPRPAVFSRLFFFPKM